MRRRQLKIAEHPVLPFLHVLVQPGSRQLIPQLSSPLDPADEEIKARRRGGGSPRPEFHRQEVPQSSSSSTIPPPAALLEPEALPWGLEPGLSPFSRHRSHSLPLLFWLLLLQEELRASGTSTGTSLAQQEIHQPSPFSQFLLFPVWEVLPCAAGHALSRVQWGVPGAFLSTLIPAFVELLMSRGPVPGSL